MIVSNIIQLEDFLIMLLAGFSVGLIHSLINIIHTIFTKNFVKIFIDFLFSTFCIFIFIIIVNIINLGQIRWFLCLSYTIGIVLEQITLGKLFAKGVKYLYNKLILLLQKFANTSIGRLLSK